MSLYFLSPLFYHHGISNTVAYKQSKKSDGEGAKAVGDGTARLKELLATPQQFPSATLILCPDRVRRDRILKLITEKLQIGGDSIVRRDLEELDRRELVKLSDELNTLSLFGSGQLHVLSSIEEADVKTTDYLLELLGSFPPVNKLILVGGSLPSNSRLLKAFTKTGSALVFGSLSEGELTKWVEKELKVQGVLEFPPTLIARIIESGTLVSNHYNRPLLDAILPIIELLGLYAEEGTVSKADVELLFRDKPDPSEFELIEALSRRDPARVELLCRSLLEGGKSPFLLLALFSNNYSTTLSIKGLLERGLPKDQICRTLALNPWRFDKQIPGVRANSVGKLRSNLQSVLRTDSKLKNHSLDPDHIISDLLSSLSV